MPMLEILVLGLRALQFLFAIIVLGLTGHVASWGLSPSQNSFLLFTAVWTLLILLYVALTPKFMASFANVFAILALDALTMLFWFAGFIALAVLDRDFHRTGLTDGFGVYNACDISGNWCGTITAAVVFGAFEWVLFVITTVLAAMEGLRSRRNGGSTTTTTSAPMAQPVA